MLSQDRRFTSSMVINIRSLISSGLPMDTGWLPRANLELHGSGMPPLVNSCISLAVIGVLSLVWLGHLMGNGWLVAAPTAQRESGMPPQGNPSLSSEVI